MKKYITIVTLTTLTFLVTACGSDLDKIQAIACKGDKVTPKDLQTQTELIAHYTKEHAGDSDPYVAIQAIAKAGDKSTCK